MQIVSTTHNILTVKKTKTIASFELHLFKQLGRLLSVLANPNAESFTESVCEGAAFLAADVGRQPRVIPAQVVPHCLL